MWRNVPPTHRYSKITRTSSMWSVDGTNSITTAVRKIPDDHEAVYDMIYGGERDVYIT